ncbi:MAG: hypothetical protein PHF00_01430 [Elusimicrobia bacterium]|nr:hypothetical protein [Elusimicrobiota bacterium]
MRAAAGLLALALTAGPALAVEEVGPECPKGTRRALSDNPYEPFACVPNRRRPFDLTPGVGAQGFSVRPRCPRGFHPVTTPDRLQPYRCAKDSYPPAEPVLDPEPDADGRTRSWRVRSPAAAASGAKGPRAARGCAGLAKRAFGRYSIPGEIALEYPKDWHLTDAWPDVPPTLYVVFDAGRAGKQVTMTATLLEAGQPDFQELDLAVLKEREWQGAREDAAGSVAGLPARFMTVPKSSRSAYVRLRPGRYLLLVYSAPEDLYQDCLPAFTRLLQTLAPGERIRREPPSAPPQSPVR